MHYVPMWKGKPVSLTGFFQAADDRNFIGIEMSSADPFGTICHEYAHSLLRSNFPVMPLWFEEGFAEYFSTLQIVGNQVQYGGIPPQYAAMLTSSQWMPITALFTVQHDSDDYNESDRRSMFYAESWLAVHYLMSNDHLADAFKYLHLAQIQHVPIPDAIQQAFGVDAATFEKNLRAYLASNPVPGHMAMPEPGSQPFVTKKISDFDAQATLADMHAHSSDYNQQALGEFQAVLKADQGNEIANRGLGYWYLRNEHYDQARQAFQNALAVNNNDAQLHYLVAYLMNREVLKTGAAPRDAIAMRRELEAAIQLDPSLADAYNLLAFALAADRKYDLGIQAEKKAIELNPSAEIYQANLAHIYLQAHVWDDAEGILRRLELSTDPKIRDNANQNLAELKAERLADAQKQQARARGVMDPTAPQWQVPADMKPAESAAPDEKADTRKTLYTYAELESVDCTRDPVAIVTVRKAGKLMRLRTDDYHKLMVMGADEFSCGWRGKKVLVNYKPGGRSDGDLVTLEVEAGK